MNYAACYIRVSTDEQTEYSPDSQLKLIRDYAEKNDIVLLEDFIFMEDGGKSGKSMSKREKFLEMIAAAKKKPKPFDLILVWKFSRFARNMEEAITVKSMLKKNDIDVVSISEPLPEGPFGELIERILEWQDEFYLTNLSQEVKRGMKERVSRGLPVSRPPIGYDLIKNEYVPNSEAEFVKGIFNDFLDNMGLRAIAVKYGNLGMRTKRGNMPDNRCIEYVLRNPVYTGKIRWSVDGYSSVIRDYDNPNVMIVHGNHKPIIDQSIFDRVQIKLNEQKKLYSKYQRREQTFNYMLKGLVRCSSCGATLINSSSRSLSMQCHNYGRGTCNVSHSITMERANNAVIACLEECLITDKFNFEKVDTENNNSQKTDYEKLINNERAKLNRIKLAYQNGIDTLEEYTANKAEIMKNIEKLQVASVLSPPKFDLKEYQSRVLSVLKIIRNPKESEEVKNTALRTIIKKIIFNKSAQKFEVYFY